MAWFKVDDKLHDHEKPTEAGQAAMGLWVMAGSWSADNLTDGFIPDRVLSRWGRKRDADALVLAGLWLARGDGWKFNDWDEYQPTGDEVKAKRLEARERMAKVRANKSRTFARSSQNVRSTPSRPVPTRPDLGAKAPNPAPASAVAVRVDARFNEFWDAYGKKVGKGAAEKAFTKAAKKADPLLIIQAAHEHADYHQRLGTEARFIPHPSKWLNEGRWADERSARDERGPRGARQVETDSMFDAAMQRAVEADRNAE